VGLDLRGLRRLLLEVNLGKTLDLLRLVLTVHLHLAGWCVKGVLRVLHLVELPLGVVEVKLKVVELVLEKLERSVMVHHRVLKLLDLALELGDQSTPALELVAGLTKLLVPQLDGQV